MAFNFKVNFLHLSLYVTLIVAGFLTFSPVNTFALDIQNLDYQIGDQTINQVPEHTITFDSISPIAIGNSVSINFPNEFSFSSSPVASDVDVRVNGVLLTPSDWSFSQSLSTIFITFQSTAAPSSDVTITLTNDIDLKNPSNQGSYIVNFGVNATFVATAEVWIFPSKDITVSGVVLGAPIIVGGGSSANGSGTCYNCFFNDERPFYDEQGIILSFKGFGPPRGSVSISMNNSLVGSTDIDENGIFLISIDNVSADLHTLTFVGFDRNNVATGPQALTLTVGDRGFVYSNDVFLSPTVSVEPRGDYGLILYGYTVPYAELDLNIDGFFVGTVVANGQGLYFLETSLSQFEIGDHTVASILKGLTRNLNSEEKIFTILPVYNSDKTQLQFAGDPLFDVLISTSPEINSRWYIIPYIISFLGGALLLWLLVILVKHIRSRDPYLSDYES